MTNPPPASNRRFRLLRTFLREPAGFSIAILEAALFLSIARALVKWVPFSRWRRTVATRKAISAPNGDARAADARSVARARRLARVVRRVASLMPFEAACLPRAVALQWMLRRRGVASRLVFGARRNPEDDELDLHAWLTSPDGTGLIGARQASKYATFPGFGD